MAGQYEYSSHLALISSFSSYGSHKEYINLNPAQQRSIRETKRRYRLTCIMYMVKGTQAWDILEFFGPTIGLGALHKYCSFLKNMHFYKTSSFLRTARFFNNLSFSKNFALFKNFTDSPKTCAFLKTLGFSKNFMDIWNFHSTMSHFSQNIWFYILSYLNMFSSTFFMWGR